MYLFLYNHKITSSFFFSILILWVDLNDHLEKLAFSLKNVLHWFLSLEGESVSTVSQVFATWKNIFPSFLKNDFLG